jgi:hypothetical protein
MKKYCALIVLLSSVNVYADIQLRFHLPEQVTKTLQLNQQQLILDEQIKQIDFLFYATLLEENASTAKIVFTVQQKLPNGNSMTFDYPAEIITLNKITPIQANFIYHIILEATHA